MKRPPLARIPARVKTALQETADYLGGVEFDTVITAAAWAFCTPGEAARRHIVADFWFRGSSGLEAPRCWQPIAMPPSAAALLTRASAGHKGPGRTFSRTQEFVAALYWFSSLPLATRLELVHEFRACPEPEDRLKADPAGKAGFLPSPSQAEAASITGGS